MNEFYCLPGAPLSAPRARTRIPTRLKRFQFFTAVLFLLVGFAAAAQTVVPAGNPSGTSRYQPISTYYDYHGSDVIYLASEIGTTGTINSIGFYVNSRDAAALLDVPFTIKMQTTSATAVATSSRAYSTLSASATTVFNGTLTNAMFQANNWVTIPLTTPFNYTSGNLEVFTNAQFGTSGSNESSTARTFRWSTVTGSSRAIVWDRDTNAALNNAQATNLTQIPNTRFTFGTCGNPTAITISGLTNSAATASWTAPASAPSSGYQYELRSSGFPGSGASGLVTSGSTAAGVTTKSFTGLAASTSYSFYVRSNCGSSFSAWSVATTITTLCPSTTVLPSSESFDATAIPACWAVNAVAGNEWVPASSNDSAPAPHSGANFLSLPWLSGTLQNSFAFSQPFNLSAYGTQQARVNLWIYRNDLGVANDVLYVGINTTPTTSGAVALLTMPLLMTSSPAVTSEGWYNYTVNIPTSYNASPFYIVLRGTVGSGSGAYSLGVDDLKVEWVPPAITSFTPSTACANSLSTTDVTLTGTNLSTITGVTLNGESTPFNVVNSTTVTVHLQASSDPGTFTVTGSNGSATSASALAIVANPTVEPITGGNTALCLGDSVQLSDVSPGGVWAASGAATVDAFGLVTTTSAGTATITYTVTDNGCSTTVSTTIQVNAPIDASVPGAQTILEGANASFSVTATGSITGYQWQVSNDGGDSFSDLSESAPYSGTTTNTLAITAATADLSENLYRVIVKATAPCLDFESAPALLLVGDTGITASPQNASICSDGNGIAQFTVTATGDVQTYSWEEDTGLGFLPISDGTVDGVTFSGTTTAQLTVSGLGLAQTGRAYRATAIGAANSATSNAATLTVNQAVAIATPPQPQTICSTGGSAVLTVAASGNVQGYQWQYSSNGVNFADVSNNTPSGVTYADATTASLTVTAANTVIAGNTYFYRAVVSGAAPCGTATSASAQLQIVQPSITSQPGAASVLAGQPASFAVASADGAATYQWMFATTSGGPYAAVANGTPTGVTYAGATSATLTVNTNGLTTAGNAYFYKAVVTSGGCSRDSNPAQMTVTNYCIPSTTNVNTYFTSFSTTGGTTNITNSASGFSSGGYGNFSNLSVTQVQGLSVNFTSAIQGVGTGVGAAIWVDWNHNGTFETTERVVATTADVTVFSGSFSVPLNALAGPTRMRVMVDANVNPPVNPCIGPSGRRETEDYTFVVTTAPPCAGTPVGGTVSAAQTSICGSGSTTLTASGYTVGATGISLQWYSVSGGLIAGATSATYTTPVLNTTTSYFLRVTCAGSGLFSDSNTATIDVYNPTVTSTTPASRCGTGSVTLQAAAPAGYQLNWYASATGNSVLATGNSFATPSISANTTYYVSASNPYTVLPTRTYCASTSTGTTRYITGFSTTGGVSNISNTGTGQSANGYGDYTALSARYNAGSTVNFTATWPSATYGLSIFVDWNNDGDFDDANEKVYGTTDYVATPATGSFAIPSNAVPGSRRMRVTADYVEQSPLACGTSTTSETEDYTLIVGVCESARTAVLATVNTAPALTLSASSSSTCVGSATGTVTLTSNSANYDSYIWSPSAGVSGNAASGWTFNPTTSTVYTLSATNSTSGCSNSATLAVTANPLPAAIAVTPAATTVCAGFNALALTVGAQSGTIVVGTGTAVNNSGTTAAAYPAPYGAYYENSKQQYLIRASELTALGLVSGSKLNSIAFMVTSVNGSGVHKQYTISIGKTTQNALATWETGLSTVFGPVNYTPVAGLNTHTFSSGYTWDGTSNLVVQVCHTNDAAAGGINYTANAFVRYSTTAFNSSLTYRVDDVEACGSSSITYTETDRPNMTFAYSNGTVTWAPTAGLYTDATATTPYTGAAATTVYAKPVATATYTATITSSASCTRTSSATITVNNYYDFYVDADGDAYGTGAPVSLCAASASTPPAGYAAVGGDCDDALAAVNPGHAEVPYNGIDDNCNGTIDEGSQLFSQVLPSQCGTTLAAISSLIGAVSFALPVDGYRFEVTNTQTGQVQTIDRTPPNFNLTMLPAYDYATTYSIRVMLRRNGIWLNYYGNSCLVSTPAILDQGGAAAVTPSQCGIVLPTISTIIATTSLNGVTAYRFRITNLTDATEPNVQQVLERNLHWFSLTMLTRFNYGTEYQVEVAVKTANGVWSGYGSPCNVSSPPVPSLTDCGAIVTSTSTLVKTASLNRAQAYRFEITNMSSFEQITLDRSQNWFTFTNVPGFTPGGAYTVRVAIQTAGYWSPFGEACEVTAPGAARVAVKGDEPQEMIDFRAVVYPNPYTESFALDMDTSSEESVNVKVYDMVGKLLEDRNFAIDRIEMQQFGERYPSGVYNIVVTQAGFVKTLRVIKR